MKFTGNMRGLLKNKPTRLIVFHYIALNQKERSNMQLYIHSMESSISRNKLYDRQDQPETTHIIDDAQEMTSFFLNPIVELFAELITK